MQMLNFVKIPTLLLLLQVISINAQLNYPNTVVTIVIDPLFLKSKDENGNVDKNEFSARLESGEYYSTNKCCDVFREVAQSSVPGNWKKYRCIDVNSEIMTTNKNSAVLKVVLNLKFLYTDEKEFNKSTIARTIMNNLNNGNSSEVLANNEYMGIATVVWVETNAIDVFSNKPTSSPVTNAETVVTIVTKTNFFRWRDAKGGIQIGNFLAQSDSGEYYSTNKCCDVFREVAQSSVPGNWKKYRCIDVNYEISMNLGDTVILQMMSDIQFIYSGIKKFNNWTIYGDFWEKMKRPTFKEVYHKNDFAGFDYTASVKHI
uniref:SJCHGC02895 protein n=1 Tax=Schistosoma japonicum TaxID=6182 RepID=Q5DCG6_SCHJA|nr:SJCHGC02895 protein [Schistosoma japonicum]CAX82584.1 hypothetical protein [Schistosoma japonicum]CAX82638.1 hypothetical protein [Schistosoma japonicum]CAX82732.1 hypothetical protein [Schistosoma japonicum]CAX82754.1 hypothetical protein [Schistosoma japonicum]